LRAAEGRVRCDRADDRHHRRARPRARADGRAGRPLSRDVHDRGVVGRDAGVTVRLLPPGAHTGFLGRLCVPAALYWVSGSPVALAGMAYPGRADWSLLAGEGIAHVVCLTHDAPPYDAAPCGVSAFRLQDLVSGGPPSDPERERALIDAAAGDVVTRFERGE